MCYGYKMRSILHAFPSVEAPRYCPLCLVCPSRNKGTAAPPSSNLASSGQTDGRTEQIPLLFLHRGLPLSTSAPKGKGGLQMNSKDRLGEMQTKGCQKYGYILRTYLMEASSCGLGSTYTVNNGGNYSAFFPLVLRRLTDLD